MKVAVRVDGGPYRGIGHVKRESVLVSELRDRGHEVVLLTNTPETVNQIAPHGVGVIDIKGEKIMESFIRDHQPDIIVLDLPVTSRAVNIPVLTLDCQRKFRSYDPQLAVVHDGRTGTVNADVFINGHIYAERKRFEFEGTEPKWCLGSKYLILDKSFDKFAGQDPSIRSNPTQVLVTMGGSDVSGATPTVMRALDGIINRIDVIVGPGFSRDTISAINQAKRDCESEVTIVRNPDDFADRISDADLAVTALGMTTYELLAVGTPFVGLVTAPDQEPKAEAISNNGVGIVCRSKNDKSSIRSEVRKLLNDVDRRTEFAEKGKALVDTDGVKRISNVLETLN